MINNENTFAEFRILKQVNKIMYLGYWKKEKWMEAKSSNDESSK